MDILFCLLAGLLGVTLHSLGKAQSLIKDAKVANIDFTIKDYLKCDWLGICLSFGSVLLWLLLFEEASTKYPLIQDWVRVSFACMGFFGSYIIQRISSRGQKYIRNIVDGKTDIADAITGEENNQ
jgi:hypothetical protein